MVGYIGSVGHLFNAICQWMCFVATAKTFLRILENRWAAFAVESLHFATKRKGCAYMNNMV